MFITVPAIAQPVRGTPGDLWADLVIGQPDFSMLTPNQATNKRPWIPCGAYVDRASNPQRLYVWDSGNSRILGFSNLANANTSGSNPAAAATGADLVLGQPDFIHTACNGDSNLQNYPTYQQPTASSLCGTSQEGLSPGEGGVGANMAVDSQGNLYVPDYFNNRVLRYDAPVTSTQAASYAWGRGNTLSDFTSGYNQCNPASTTSLCLPNDARQSGVAVDFQGNLWVADSGHNRVLRFPNSGGVPSATADLVLGQSNFTSTTGASGLSDSSHMTRPVAVRVDASGNVFVADDLDSGGGNCLFHGRVLVYKAPVSSGMAASGILSNYLSWTMGLEFDPPSGGLWVSDFCNHQVILFNIDLSVSPITFTPVKVLLRDQPSPDGSAPWPTAGDGPNFNYQDGGVAQSYNVDRAWGGLGVDSSGDVFLSGVTPLQDVLRFPAPIPTIPASPTGVSHSADWEVFKPIQYGMENKIGDSGLESIDGIGVAATAGQLIVSDEWHLRYWNIPSGPQALSNNQPADGYAGINSSQAGLDIYPTYGRIREDHASPQQHLWVVRNNSGGNGFLQAYNLPLTPWQSAAATLAQPIPVLGGGNVTWQIIQGFAPDPSGNFIWIADRANSRVFRVRNPLTSPVVDVLLGQTSVAGSACNAPSGIPSATNLCLPGAVALDHQGNLYVSDHSLEASGNLRILRFGAATVQNNSATTCLFGVPASAVYGTGGNFTTTTCSGVNGACGPFEPAFSADDSHMVAGMNGYTGSRMPVVFLNPQSGDNPVATLKDYGSMFFAATFDNQDNLYVADMDRERVLIYLQPFGTPGPTSTPTSSPTDTATVTPTDTPTPTPTGTWYTSTPAATPTRTATRTPTSTAMPTATSTPGCCQLAGPWTSPSFATGGDAAGVAVDKTRHRVYVTDENANSLMVLDYSGAPITTYTVADAFAVAVGYCAYDGVYVARRNQGTVSKLDSNGNILWTSAVLAGGLRGMNVDNLGNSYAFCDSGSVFILDQSGALKATLTGSGALGAMSAPGAALKAGLNLYVADTSNSRILLFTESSLNSYSYTLSQSVVASMSTPYGIAQDGAGNIYVTNYGYQGYLIFTNNGTTWTQTGSCSLSQMDGSFQVDLDETGALYTACRNSNLVVKISPCPNYPQPSPATCTPTGTWYTPTATSTPTSTFTNSATGTFTATVSNTPTVTPTATPTTTGTLTPTSTATFTSTNTPTPTMTWTSTFTPSSTYTSTPTLTPTFTPSNFYTFTPTLTSTPGYTDQPLVWPNPCHGGTVHLHPGLTAPSDVRIRLFTTALRKVQEKDYSQEPVGVELDLNLTDRQGSPLADGLYFVVVDTSQGRSVGKLLILR